jgi:two-component sensor histidine kinase
MATTGDRPCQEGELPALRRWTVEQLSRHLPPRASPTVVEDARLVVSELVTNAIRARCSQLSLSLTVSSDGDAPAVVVEVAEDAPGRPQPLRCGPGADHGRGLTLVEALTRRWGVRETSSGKVVWAELPIKLEDARVAWQASRSPGVPA